MLSAMSATIVSLRLVEMEPVNVHGWMSNRKGEEGMQTRLGDDQNVERQDLMEVLSTRFEERMWKHVTNGGGHRRAGEGHSKHGTCQEMPQVAAENWKKGPCQMC